MPLINCEVELKLIWSKHFFLSVGGTDNVNGNNDDNNIIFTIKDTKLYVPVVTLLARDNHNLLKLLSKGFEGSVYWKEYKTKTDKKLQQTNLDIFLNQILLESIDYLL